MSGHLALALDPGGTTGAAYGQIDTADNSLVIALTQAPMSLVEMFDTMNYMCERKRGSRHIIWESFEYRYRARPGLDQSPIKMIAIIELFKEWYGETVGFYSYTAAQGKSFYDDDKLKKMKLYERGQPHARDAQRHLLQWCTFGYGGKLLRPRPTIEMMPIGDFMSQY